MTTASAFPEDQYKLSPDPSPGPCPWDPPSRYTEEEMQSDAPFVPPTITPFKFPGAVDSPPSPVRRKSFPAPDRLADMPARGVEWLWPGRIPIGKVTLLVGDPGVGKSLLALDVAARTTANAPWPDAPSSELAPDPSPLAPRPSDIRHSSFNNSSFPILSPSNQKSEIINQKSPTPSALIFAAEDDPADTIRPRLEALGADLSRIVVNPPPALFHPGAPLGPDAVVPIRQFHALRDASALDADRPLDLHQDLDGLKNMLDRIPDCRLVVFDPLSAFLGRNVENFNYEVRRLLAPLADLAARRRLAIVAVAHLRKQRGAAVHRTLGSLAFTAVARAGWLIAADPADASRRLMLPLKNNLAASGDALAFSLVSAQPGGPPRLVWEPTPLIMSINELLSAPKKPALRPSPELDDAVRWLRQALAGGVRPMKQIESHALAHGLRLVTLRRAFRQLGGEAVRTGFGPFGRWHWRLPGVGPQEPTESHDHLWDD